MNCPNCHAPIPDGSDRCEKCGTVIAPQSVDRSWKKEYRSVGKHVAGMIIGIVLLATLFPINAILALGSFGASTTDSGSSTAGAGVFFTIFAVAALIVGLILLIKSVVTIKKVKKHNAELTEQHKLELEAEKAERERQAAQKLQQAQNQGSATAFNAGTTGKLVFELNGAFSSLQVYEDRVALIAKTNVRSFAAGKFFNGTKEIFFDDMTNIQFRETTKRINGYLQFDYPGAVNISNSGLARSGGNYSSENSFIFDTTVTAGAAVLPGENPVTAANRIVGEAYRYIHGRLMEEKKARKTPNVVMYAQPTNSPTSAADELKKYNDLLQSGAISQEEYDDIKKKLIEGTH